MSKSQSVSTFRAPGSDFRCLNILHSFNRRRELRRLLRWAHNRKLSGPARLYQNRLSDVEVQLSQHAMRHRTTYRIARMIHILNTLLFPMPHYYRPGAAQAYRVRVA